MLRQARGQSAPRRSRAPRAPSRWLRACRRPRPSRRRQVRGPLSARARGRRAMSLNDSFDDRDTSVASQRTRDYGPPRLIVELTNICNLHCSYCMRDEDALYHTKANFFPAELLRRVLRGARETYGIDYISFTGGEVTLHPRFAEIVATVESEAMQCSFVTNGWHFERVLPA